MTEKVLVEFVNSLRIEQTHASLKSFHVFPYIYFIFMTCFNHPFSRGEFSFSSGAERLFCWLGH